MQINSAQLLRDRKADVLVRTIPRRPGYLKLKTPVLALAGEPYPDHWLAQAAGYCFDHPDWWARAYRFAGAAATLEDFEGALRDFRVNCVLPLAMASVPGHGVWQSVCRKNIRWSMERDGHYHRSEGRWGAGCSPMARSARAAYALRAASKHSFTNGELWSWQNNAMLPVDSELIFQGLLRAVTGKN